MWVSLPRLAPPRRSRASPFKDQADADQQQGQGQAEEQVPGLRVPDLVRLTHVLPGDPRREPILGPPEPVRQRQRHPGRGGGERGKSPLGAQKAEQPPCQVGIHAPHGKQPRVGTGGRECSCVWVVRHPGLPRVTPPPVPMSRHPRFPRCPISTQAAAATWRKIRGAPSPGRRNARGGAIPPKRQHGERGQDVPLRFGGVSREERCPPPGGSSSYEGGHGWGVSSRPFLRRISKA